MPRREIDEDFVSPSPPRMRQLITAIFAPFLMRTDAFSIHMTQDGSVQGLSRRSGVEPKARVPFASKVNPALRFHDFHLIMIEW